jgi:NosR/NirI family transcriptional regulator, nitrous oxide reductase regulator
MVTSGSATFASRSAIRAICIVSLLITILLLGVMPARAQSGIHLGDFLKQTQLSDVFPGADRVGPVEGNPPAAAVYRGDQALGFVYLNSDVVSSTGYSGKPIRILVGIDINGRIVGAKLVEHHEPIVLIGIPAAKLTAFIHGYVGLDIGKSPETTLDSLPVDIISGATVTTMVIGDSITRSAIQVAQSRGLGTPQAVVAPAATVKRLSTANVPVEPWQALLGDGSVRRLLLTIADVNAAFAKSANPLAAQHPDDGPDSDDFIDLYVAEASVPGIGRSLLGDAGYQRLKDRLQPGQQTILIAGSGRYSFKGSGYVRGGIFDRIQLVQGDNIIRFHDRDHQRIGDIVGEGAPGFPEIGLFTIPAGEKFDPTEPWRLILLAQREIGARDKAFLTFDVTYTLPSRYVIVDKPAAAPLPPAPVPAPVPVAGANMETDAPTITWRMIFSAVPGEPLWIRIWRAKIGQVFVLSVALLALTAIFFFQDILVRRPALYHRLRLAFLTFTLLWIGWYADAQLSVVNILAFANALRADFRWDYFLMDPLIFLLWFSVAAALLFWGRGAYCGWLCPFGALQELLSAVAKKLRIPQLSIPFGIHQRLWPIKYIIFLIIFGLSLYYLSLSEEVAEVEPFKTVIILHFMREWPFVLYAVVVLSAGLFVERFFCRYLCPLGAALAIPAKLRMFDWLRRYRECGSPCQRCANECPVQAIHPEGHINPNECIQCLHCQELYHDDHRCPVMIQRRLKSERRAAVIGSPPPLTGKVAPNSKSPVPVPTS